ncbi:TadE/TadG family type IV pilus assembly protein [Manganibacter manganicus]|uniref:TadE/TadG family type IV pilus assembly protein n=1 Tax=Manganibacter manganicus TaxID=1873176 RepID=UPI0009BBB3B3|nr:TadE/TadG family type IV pilus assembly protein [Pseudaminobacter manganicus]
MDWKISGRQVDGVDRIAAKFAAHAKAYPACKKGNFAVMFGLALIPILAAVGVSVDYVRAYKVQTFMQDEVDTTALGSARLGQTGNYDPLIQLASTTINQRFGNGAWIEGLDVQGHWISATDFQVDASGTVPVTILSAVPGMPGGVPVSASATVRVAEPKYIYPPPTLSELDPDADDYNRIYVYCFDKTKKSEPDKGRSEEVAIADNAGTKYSYTMPSCDPGQVLSYRLKNVRNARKNKDLWDSKTATPYDYYTDTVLNNEGAEMYDLGGWKILQTVLCANLNECKGKSKGGILPEGTGQNPTFDTAACSPGKFMYYGWEDRPPGRGSSDQDYNDIRIIMSCPTVEAVGDRTVRLIR